MSWASSETSVQILEPHFAFLMPSNVLAFLSSARSCRRRRARRVRAVRWLSLQGPACTHPRFVRQKLQAAAFQIDAGVGDESSHVRAGWG